MIGISALAGKGINASMRHAWGGMGFGGEGLGMAPVSKGAGAIVGQRQGTRKTIHADFRMTVRADADFRAYQRRIHRAPKEIQRQAKNMIARAARKEIVRPLREATPVSKRMNNPGTPKHLRSTARILSSRPWMVEIGLGNKHRWYGAIVNAVHPTKRGFYQRTIHKAQAAFLRSIRRDVAKFNGWMATGRRPTF